VLGVLRGARLAAGAALAFALCVVCRAGTAHADGHKLVVVVAKGSALTTISRSDLRRCFTGERIAVGDRALVPFNASPSSREREGFDRAVLGMSPDEVGRFWVDRKIRGQGGPPRSLPSPAYIAKVAAKFPGAIGYLPADQLTADVQPVAVDGVPYTDAHYDIAAP
jgi:hypothetical protein